MHDMDFGLKNKRTIPLYTKGWIFLVLIFSYSIIVSALIGWAELLDTQMRSTSLQTEVTEDGNIQRIDYVNDNGEITYAANLHYATVIRTEKEKSLLEEFFDEYGHPVRQEAGYYALLWEYNEQGQKEKLTYLDLDKKPITIRSGYAMIIRKFDKNGRVLEEHYYDTEGEPTSTVSQEYGCRKEYNELGRNTLITYVDKKDTPMISTHGFASMRKTFYEEGVNIGRVKDEFYFDEKGNPISLLLGQYGMHKEYDELGRVNIITYLNVYGSPANTNEGFAKVVRTFYENDAVKTEFYYDINGNAVSLAEGQYGTLKKGEKTVFLDAQGNEVFNIKNLLYNSKLSVILTGLLVLAISVMCSKRINFFYLFLYVSFIIYMTLMYRRSGFLRYNFQLFWSYRQFFSDVDLRWEILNNIFLFIPLGMILYQVCPRWQILIISLFLSVFIEFAQYVTRTGLCEYDDIISNGLGSAIGFGTGAAMDRLIRIVREDEDTIKLLKSAFKERLNKYVYKKKKRINASENDVQKVYEKNTQINNGENKIFLENPNWEIICAAIRISLMSSQDQIQIPGSIKWEDILLETKKQGITSIVRNGLKSFIPPEEKLPWEEYVFQGYCFSMNLLEEQNSLVRLLEENQIPFCILKGTAAAVYYPKPLLRLMGDVDFIIQEQFFEKAQMLLIRSGYLFEAEKKDDGRHIIINKNNIIFEMHHHFSLDQKDVPIDYLIQKAMDRLERGNIDGIEFPMLPKLENGLVILDHLRQHLYSGLGMRQILDWMMYVNAVLDDVFWKTTFCPVARALGLERLAKVTTRLCQFHLGLPMEIHWCADVDVSVCDQLLANLIESGNFGNEHGLGRNVEEVMIHFRKEGLFRYLQYAGEFNWKAYHRHHWLKPLAWFYQILRYLRQGVYNGRTGETLKNDFYRSSKRYELLKNLDLM